MDYEKKFLVIGNFNMVTYKEIFPYIKEGKLRTGKNWVKEFNMPDGKKKKFGNICWFTNLETHKADDPMELVEKFDPVNKHLHYDNYDAYNVDKVADIPYDTDEVLGCPITIIDRIADDGYIHFTHTSERERIEVQDNRYKSSLLHNNSGGESQTETGECERERCILSNIYTEDIRYRVIGHLNNSNVDSKEKDGYLSSVNTLTIIQGKEKMWNGPVVNKHPKFSRICIQKL